MAVIRVNKTSDYTVMANNHFKEREMTLKAKGLLSLMLSLPEGWDFSTTGLMALSKDGYDGVRLALRELEKFRYLKRTPIREGGKFVDWQYDVYEQPYDTLPETEKPQTEKPLLEKPILAKPLTANPQQLNTKELNTKEVNTKKENTKVFVPPTLEEVKAYCEERKNDVDPKRFFDYFDAANWVDSKGQKVRSWKQKVITWETQGRKDGKASGTKGTTANTGDAEETPLYGLYL